jgi:CheY-like chemotaxis protein
VSKHLEEADQGQFDKYVGELNDFIDAFPGKEAVLRSYLEKKDIESVTIIINGFWQNLKNIYADDLADECLKHLNNFKNSNFERISAYTSYFLSVMAALSIDIQMALYMDENNTVPAKIESNGEEKILLAVDDDAFSLDMLKMALKDVRCKVIGVTSGSGALNILKTQKPSLFVLDIDMPSMDGIELASKIRGMGFSQPIVFITGNADKSYVVKAVKAGGADFILKPIKHQNAVSRIGKFI